jgi:TonB family protein
MGYQALLFCPDEKTARTVTQVLSDLEFSVDPCLEPFAAVKRLMGEHFDAVVVDCDNEQNATLLFKSARNSTSNHSSLAVAVVEGQAGVAKAFRIGANLVLTKPINVEQAKGTLRVARGLLRKGDPAKAAAPTAAQVAAQVAAKSPAPAAIPPTAARPAAPAISPAALPPRPSAPAATVQPTSTSIPKPAVPARTAAASSAPQVQDVQDEDPLEIILEDSAPPSSLHAAPVAPAAFKPAPHSATTNPQPWVQAASPSGQISAGLASGAASAPARARTTPNVADHLFETTTPPEEKNDQAISAANLGSEPSFTFGGANAPAESSGGSKRVLLAVAAVVVVAAALYAGWTQFHTKSSAAPAPSAANPPVSAPVASSPVAQPAKAQPAPPSGPLPSSSAAASQPDSSIGLADNSTLTESSQPTSAKHQPAPEKHIAVVPTANSLKASASSPAGKTAASNPEAATEPLVVKTGTAVPGHAKPAVDAPAPSMIGLTPSASGGSLSNLVAGGANAPQPILQTVNVSQGVSRGLLIKKVPPSYPPNALRMRVEGTVDLMATIAKSGNITAVKVLSGDPLLAKAAQDAVKQWKYKPYLLNGEPVEIQTQVTINFKLPR